MFDIGFSELLLIGIVALVVIGPERLPKVARTAGHLFGRMQRYVADVKADINREIHVEELQKLQEQLHASVNSIEQAVAKEMRQGSEAVAEQIHEIVELPNAHGKSVTPVDESSHDRPPNPPPPAGEGDAGSLREFQVKQQPSAEPSELAPPEPAPLVEAPQPQLELNLDAPPADDIATPARNIAA